MPSLTQLRRVEQTPFSYSCMARKFTKANKQVYGAGLARELWAHSEETVQVS